MLGIELAEANGSSDHKGAFHSRPQTTREELQGCPDVRTEPMTIPVLLTTEPRFELHILLPTIAGASSNMQKYLDNPLSTRATPLEYPWPLRGVMYACGSRKRPDVRCFAERGQE